MLAATLYRCSEIQNLVGRESRRRDHTAQRGPAAGERARLVEDDRVDLSRHLQSLTAADQDARFGSLARPDHDCRRRCQAHGARARDHDDRDERHQGVGQLGVRAEHEPEAEGEGADAEDHGHEDAADPIRQTLDRRLGALGPPDQVDDVGQCGVAPDPRRPHQEGPVAVDRSADHFVAGPLLDRHRLARQHRLVDRRIAFRDAPVHSNALARPYPHQVAYPNLLERHVYLAPTPNDSSRSSLQSKQRLDGANGLGLRPGFQPPPHQDQADDRGRAVEVRLRLYARGTEYAGGQSHEDAVGPCRGCADHHESVHAGRAVDGRPQRRAVEAPSGPELHERRRSDQHPGQPFHSQRQDRRVHQNHRPGCHGERNGRRQTEGALLAGPFGCFRVGLVDQAGARAIGGLRQLAHLVPGRLDGPYELIHAGELRQVSDGRHFGCKVDVGLRHPRGLAQEAFDAVHARCAAHTLDRQLDLGRWGGGRRRGDGLHTPWEYSGERVPAATARDLNREQAHFPAWPERITLWL